jgi:spermidine synthase
MAISYQHPKVKVHVGDGFKFLDDYKNEFDVIITDSSDPEGPAESLFQKPYFELLFGALKEGGVITTQGCTSPTFAWIWLCILATSCLLRVFLFDIWPMFKYASSLSLSIQGQARLI